MSILTSRVHLSGLMINLNHVNKFEPNRQVYKLADELTAQHIPAIVVLS